MNGKHGLWAIYIELGQEEQDESDASQSERVPSCAHGLNRIGSSRLAVFEKNYARVQRMLFKGVCGISRVCGILQADRQQGYDAGLSYECA